jgi:hypothetical protein
MRTNSTLPWNKRERETTPHKLYNPHLFPSNLFLYFLSLFSRREGGGAMVGGRVRICRLCRSNHTSFIAQRCNNWEGKAAGLCRRGKNDFMCHPTPCVMCPISRMIWQSYPKWAPMIVVGSAKAQGLKAKLTNQVRAAQSNQRKERSNTKDGQQLVHPVPHRGDLTSSSFIPGAAPSMEGSGAIDRVIYPMHHWGAYTPYQETTQPLQAEEMGPPT